MGKQALITGITGQDGAYLAEYLLDLGYYVDGFFPRRSSDGGAWRLDELGITRDIGVVSGDITCPASVTAAMSKGQYDEVYNLAAQSFVAESFNSPISTMNTNCMGVINVLEAVRTTSPHTRIYQASTSEMFGLVNVEAQNEDTPFHPRSPYGVAKAAAHYAVQNYREAYGLYAVSGILFNHESPLRGTEFVTRKVTSGLAKILAGKQDKVVLGNIEAYRDWGHAQDYIRAMHMMLTSGYGQDFVVATGETHQVLEFVDLACEVAGLDRHDVIAFDERFMRPSDVPLLCGDPAHIKRELGWEPTYTFDDLVCEMMDADIKRYA